MSKQVDAFIADHGATCNLAHLRKCLDSEAWEEGCDRDQEVRRVYLGSVFSCYPSGKFYAPFASSNVDPCPACHGQGSLHKKQGKRVLARNKARVAKIRRLAIKRARYPKRLSKVCLRASARVYGTFCHVCDGIGSIEAAADAQWREALEESLSAIGLFLEHGEDPCDLFAGECRDRPAGEYQSTEED